MIKRLKSAIRAFRDPSLIHIQHLAVSQSLNIDDSALVSVDSMGSVLRVGDIVRIDKTASYYKIKQVYVELEKVKNF